MVSSRLTAGSSTAVCAISLLFAQPIQLAQVPFDRNTLIIGHDLSCKPISAKTPKQIGMRTGWDEVGVQDRMHLVLDLRAVPDNLVAARHQPPQGLGIG